MAKPIKRIFAKSPVNIKRECYAMATLDGDQAEITMYGDVVESRPVDWWTGEPIEGSFIILSEFLEDLDTLSKAKTIDIRLNSVGGDAYAGLAIYNRLNELKADITVTVDAVAMSAASLIMCAGDIVKVSPTSIVMIHGAAVVLRGYYNASDTREIQSMLDTCDEAYASAYAKKTGLSESEVSELQDATTYMTGKEAVAKGFADELIEDGEQLDIAASADRMSLTVNGRTMRLPSPLPDTMTAGMKKVETDAGDPATDKTDINQPDNSGGKKGGITMPKTLEELKAENPELYEKLMADARAAATEELGNAAAQAAADERKRIQAIDEVASQFDDETVRAAKYGDKPCTAQEMTYQAAVKASKDGKAFLGGITEDAKASGAQDVAAAPGEDEQTKLTNAKSVDTAKQPQSLEEARALVQATFGNNGKEGK